MIQTAAYRTLVSGLVLYLLAGAAAAADFHLQPVRTVALSPGNAFVDVRVVDYNLDGFDDLAYISQNQFVVYSPATEARLLEINAVGLIGGVVADIDGNGLFDVILLNRRDSLLAAMNGLTDAQFVRKLPIVYWYWSEGPKNTPADLAVIDINHDQTMELLVARAAECWGAWCLGSYDLTDAGWLLTFALPNYDQTDYYDQSNCNGQVWSDDHLRLGDLDGDGLMETITFGYRRDQVCSWDSESGVPYERIEYDLTLYNQLGQRIAGFVQDYGLQVAVGDLDPALPGDELIFSGPRSLSGEEPPLNWRQRFVYVMDLDNGVMNLRWAVTAEESVQRFLFLPALPHAVAIDYPSEERWRILNGADGTPLGDIHGLRSNCPTLGGRFTAAADTGLQVVQVSDDSLVLFGPAVPTDIEDGGPELLPELFALYQNYPNPFNPTTQFAFSLPAAGETTLEIFNIAGQRVAVPLHDYLTAGEHLVVWDGSDFASGVYLYRLTQGDYSQSRKMMLLK